MKAPGKRNILLIVAGTLAAGLLTWAVWPEPQRVETARLVQGDYVRELVEEARTRVRERHTVAAPLSGHLLRPTLKVGDAVQAGQVLAEIVPASPGLLDARSQGEQAERVAAMQASLARAQAQQSRAQAAEAQARNELQRQQALAAQGFISPAQLDSVQLALTQRQHETAMARQEIEATRHELQRLRIGLAQPMPGTADGRKPAAWAVRAPVTGRILRLHQASAGPVAAGTPLLELGDPSSLEVVAELLTEDASALPARARATLSLTGQPPLWPAQLRLVEPGAFTRVSALGVQEQRTLAIFDSLQAPPARLGDGYRLTIRIVMEEAQAVPLAPVSAVFAQGSGHAVFVIEGGRARLRPVELRSRNGQHAWLQTTLPPGTLLVAYPGASLQDGDRVAAAPMKP